MKILQINSVCGYGSTGRIAEDIYHVLQDQGHDCVIAYGRGTAPAGVKTIKIGSKLDNYYNVIQTRLFDKHGFGSKKATRELILEIEKYEPDIIHLHNLHGYYINLEILFDYLAKADKPVVWTLHDCWAFTGHCAHFDFIQCDKWKTGCYDCPQIKEYPTSLFYDNAKWSYHKKQTLFTSVKNMRIVTPSYWLAELVKQSFLKKYPVDVVHNGIDLSVFRPVDSNFREKFHLEDKTVILGVASVWEDKKGLKYFKQLSEILEKTYKIIIVGINEHQKKQLPDSILGILRTNDQQELAEIYTASDIFVNPTLEETLGLVNVESLACGTPVITFDTGGSPECVDETCGLVVKKGDIDALTAGIHSINTERFDKKSCEKKAELFEKNKMFSAYLDIYKELSTSGR